MVNNREQKSAIKENFPRGYLIPAKIISLSIHQSQAGQFLLKHLYFTSSKVMPFGNQSAMDCFAYCLANAKRCFWWRVPQLNNLSYTRKDTFLTLFLQPKLNFPIFLWIKPLAMSPLVFSRGLLAFSKEHPCAHLSQQTPAVYGACILYTASISNDMLMSVLHGNE